MSHDLRRQQRRPVRAARGVSPVKVTVAVVASLVAVIVLFAAGIAAETYNHGQPVVAGPVAKPSPAGPGLGDPVRDGKLEFVVTRVDCSRTSIGVEHLKRTATGKFCVVSLSVRNIGDGVKLFVGRAQKLYDTAGTEYGSDEVAGIYANQGTESFLHKLDPGGRVAGRLVFDVPKKARPATVKLHDSLLSGGAEVRLG
ncbi:DUF4352 domain-containing protein [Actinoplanes sp. HUAS TT8]|uniref:DUF4352 domain-containing protein n=1 Tax=Actinoplanes sp. HUAS TT8 TaxID=3447453 RepID=UPI003F525528